MPTISEQALISRIEDEHAQNARNEFRLILSDLAPRIETPIERVLLSALYVEFSYGQTLQEWGLNIEFMKGPNRLYPYSFDIDGYIYPQIKIGEYRVDFLIEIFTVVPKLDNLNVEKPWLSIVVECDGHEFHERTKKQAKRDKSRDRWFQNHGYVVLRFTGSEIWEDAGACAHQVADTITRSFDRTFGIK
jgi:very-short-patch-repair endonuclease